MAGIDVKTNKIYMDRPLRSDETKADGYYQGKPPGRDLHDTVLESHDHRRRFQENDGDISIIVEAGEELGDIGVCVQYEGQIVGDNTHLANQCVSKQSEVIHDAANWLHEILSEFETGWEAHVESAPCPVANQKLEVRSAVARLQGVDVSHETSVTPVIPVERKVDVK